VDARLISDFDVEDETVSLDRWRNLASSFPAWCDR